MVLNFSNIENFSNAYAFRKLSFKGSLFKKSVESALVPKSLLKSVIPGHFVETKSEVYTYHEKISCTPFSFSVSLPKHDLTFEDVEFFNIETCVMCVKAGQVSSFLHLVLALKDLLIFKNNVNNIMSFDAFNPFNINQLNFSDATKDDSEFTETVFNQYASLLRLQVSYPVYLFYLPNKIISHDVISFLFEEVKKVFAEMFKTYSSLVREHEKFLQINVYKQRIEALTRKHFNLSDSFTFEGSELALVNLNENYKLGYIFEDVEDIKEILKEFNVKSLPFLMKTFLASFNELDYGASFNERGSMIFKEEIHRVFLMKVILSTYQVEHTGSNIFFVMPLEVKKFLIYLNSKSPFKNSLYPLWLTTCEIENVQEDVLETFSVLASDAKVHSNEDLKALWETASLL